MRTLWAVYRESFRLTVLEMSQYRVNLAIWILSLIAEPIIYMTVWTIVTQEQGGTVGGLTAGQFSAYYITWMLVRHFTVTLAPDAIEWRVRNGIFSGLLLRPLHPIHQDVGSNLGYKLVALPIILAIMFGLALVFPPTFQLQPLTALLFVPAVILGYLIRFITHWVLGLSAFWITRTQALFGLYFVAEIFLTGRFAPMSILPDWIEAIATVSPFRWMIAFPVELILGIMPADQIPFGFLMQALWLFVMIGVLRVVWAAGVRQYTAVSG
ncbi:MAG: ABC-2 family transporter protein [Anaerolineae bacterium]|jgi:ABC-2 type transport system permease protein|nr:ABC-2 family transporter protein [Anaerolineae bacterium]